MNLWNYIGELLLFRWMFGKRNSNRDVCYNADRTDYLHHRHNVDDDFSPVENLHTAGPSNRGADIYDDEDDALDDYDPTDSDDYQFNGSTKTYGNHNDYGYSQSYDNFNDEQDDYAIMDDDF